ncbi:WD40 repeat domain-containing protein [Nonomuraea sp. NPDC049784]|uniref:WD40 repeat domain-containing protein n=1 Tax=Nonomuraea sp. NPDC049784 TaxID=3154361 RepID=UPI003410978E
MRKPDADEELPSTTKVSYGRWRRLGPMLVAGVVLLALLIGIGVPISLRAHTVSEARAIALDGIKQRGSDWYAADLLGYVAVLSHSDSYTRSALAETLTEERRGFLPGTATVIDVAMSSDGRLALVSDAQEGSGLWGLERNPEADRENLTGSRSTILDRGYGPVALSSDGRIAVIGDETSGDIKMWDLSEDDNPRRTVVRTGNYTGRLLDISLSADGMTLFAGFESGSVEIWSLGAGQKPRLLTRVREHTSGVSVVSASADGRKLLTISEDSAIVWSLNGPLHPALSSRVKSAEQRPAVSGWGGGVMSADGRRAIIGRTVWDVTDPARPTRVGSLPSPAEGGAPLAVAGDGSIVATVENEPGGVSSLDPVVIWGLKDPSHPILLATLRVPESQSRQLAMNEGGTVIAVGTRVGGAYSWLLPKLRANFIRDACVASQPLRPPPGFWERISEIQPPDVLNEEPFNICSRL